MRGRWKRPDKLKGTPGYTGFKDGHDGRSAPFLNRGPLGMRGKWKRPDNALRNTGFQPGHPSYYTGGSVIGHLPTNTKGADGSLGKRMGGARKSRSKEREIMEALQNGKNPAELKKRYPPLQVERLSQLHAVAIDSCHRDFIKAQILVREILVRNESGGDGTRSEDGGHTITLLHGTAERVPLPGGAPLQDAAQVRDPAPSK